MINIPKMQREDLHRCNPELCAVMEGMDMSGGEGGGGGDNLADLMDMAGQ